MKKIGIFGGTFDPIHFGHLNLAIELMEKKDLNEVWFVPAQINPHKLEKNPPVSLEHRLAMLQLATEDTPGFIVQDIEGKRPSPSYTVDTLREFIANEKQETSPNQFYLILGEDSIPGFFQWHLPDEIIKLTPLLIGSRSGLWTYDNPGVDPVIKEAIQKGLTQTRIMDISSTEVRDRLEKKLYSGHLIPAKVLAYIKQNQLYQSNR